MSRKVKEADQLGCRPCGCKPGCEMFVFELYDEAGHLFASGRLDVAGALSLTNHILNTIETRFPELAPRRTLQ